MRCVVRNATWSHGPLTSADCSSLVEQFIHIPRSLMVKSERRWTKGCVLKTETTSRTQRVKQLLEYWP